MKQKGMTLIELMIVVAIIGIISAIAYPSYQSYVQKTRRTVAQGDLLEMAQWLEREYTVNGSYPTDSASLAPGIFTNDGGGAYYTPALLSGGTATAYTLVATPTTQGGQNEDPCGSLTLTSTGIQGSTSATVAVCWKN